MPTKILSNVRLIQKCIVINKDKQILALKRAPDDHSRGGNWDLPGGGYEQGEAVVAAIKREVMEEAGLTVNSLRPIFIDNHMNIKSGFFAGLNVFGICYVSNDWEGEVQISDEHTEYKWVTPEELKSYSFGEDNGFFVEALNAYTSSLS